MQIQEDKKQQKRKTKKMETNQIVTTDTFKEVARHDWNSEIDVGDFLAALISMTGAKRVLEIGVFEGETSIKMIEAMPNGSYYVGNDINNYRKHVLKKDGVVVDLKMGMSLTVMNQFEDEFFDLIFVDGDHSWANILPEFKKVERIISKTGVIAYHDAIHIMDVANLMKYVKHYKYNVITLNTSEGRGLALIQR
jgi:predicted O-methyltransferase YrrM